MPPGLTGINVRKTARQAGKDRGSLQGTRIGTRVESTANFGVIVPGPQPKEARITVETCSLAS